MTVAGCSKLTFVGAQLCVGSPSSLNMKVTVILCGSLLPESEQNRQFFSLRVAERSERVYFLIGAETRVGTLGICVSGAR
jgi:hypothetical protein